MSSPSSASFTFTLSSSPSATGLYIPVHKRSSSTSSSSGRLSPKAITTPKSGALELPPVLLAPSAYSIEELLALRPLADENMKQRMRETCPEVVMNRKMRKSIGFVENQRKKQEASSAKQHGPETTTVTPVMSVITPIAAAVSLPGGEPPSLPTAALPVHSSSTPASVNRSRNPVRRTRPGVRTGGVSDRRRSALAESWRKVPVLVSPLVAL